MQCNGMEWNGMYACMYTVHIPISSHIALVFFPSVGFGPILFQLNSRGPGPGSKWPDPPVSVSPMAFVPWKSWKSAQLRMEWYMNDTSSFSIFQIISYYFNVSTLQLIVAEYSMWRDCYTLKCITAQLRRWQRHWLPVVHKKPKLCWSRLRWRRL